MLQRPRLQVGEQEPVPLLWVRALGALLPFLCNETICPDDLEVNFFVPESSNRCTYHCWFYLST